MHATLDDVPGIICFYQGRPQLALDASDAGKPVFDNRCSHGHQLFNPTIIRRDRIILNPKQAISYTQPAANNPAIRLKKFRMSRQSSEYYKQLNSKKVEPASHQEAKAAKAVTLSAQFGRELFKNVQKLKPTRLISQVPYPEVTDYLMQKAPEASEPPKAAALRIVRRRAVQAHTPSI